MKRFLVASVALGFLLAGVVPVAGAAPAPAINVFEGTGSATALDLTIPGLAGVARSTGNETLLEYAKKFPGITVAHTFSSFKVDGIKNQASTSGGAASQCDLLSREIDPLTACSSSNREISSAPGEPGDDLSTCSTLTLPVELNVISLNTACSKSNSRSDKGAPGSLNEASVASAGVSLDLSALGLEETKDSVVSSVQAFVVGAVNSLPQNDLTDAAKADLAKGLEDFLTSIAQGNHIADIKVGTSSVIVDTAGSLTTVTSKAAGATVELLGVTVGSKTDYLITIEVSQAIASANWDQVKGIASAKATQALATLRIKDLAGLCELLGLNCENNYIQIVVDADAVNALLAPLNSIPLLATTITVGPATPEQTGKRVVATASGVEIHALKGLGESAAGKLDGGIDLRVAVAGVTLSGDIQSTEVAGLPLTGGPTYLYIGGAILLAGAAFGLYRWSVKLRAGARP